MSKKFPCIFLLFKADIDVTMEFFVTKMKRNTYDIIQRPKLLDFSMEKKGIPHFHSPQMLSVHVLSENVSLRTLFETIDRMFVVSFCWYSLGISH